MNPGRADGGEGGTMKPGDQIWVPVTVQFVYDDGVFIAPVTGDWMPGAGIPDHPVLPKLAALLAEMEAGPWAWLINALDCAITNNDCAAFHEPLTKLRAALPPAITAEQREALESAINRLTESANRADAGGYTEWSARLRRHAETIRALAAGHPS